jgi:hypothetical protein
VFGARVALASLCGIRDFISQSSDFLSASHSAVNLTAKTFLSRDFPGTWHWESTADKFQKPATRRPQDKMSLMCPNTYDRKAE